MRFALHCRLFALAALAALVSGAPARAAAEEHKGANDEAKPVLYKKHGEHYDPASEDDVKKAAGQADDHHGGGGLDFTGIKRYDLGIYTLIVFGILMLVLSKFAWPHIKSGLEKREQGIRGALDEAKKERTEAAALLARAKKELDETAAKVRAMLDEARRDAEALKAAEKDAGEKEATDIKDRARRDAALQMEANLKEVQMQAVQLAVLIASKALRQQMSIEGQQKLLDEAIAELGTNMKQS